LEFCGAANAFSRGEGRNRGEEQETVILSADDADNADFLGCVVQESQHRSGKNAKSTKYTAEGRTKDLLSKKTIVQYSGESLF